MEMNFIDKAVAFVNPIAGAKRMQYRMAMTFAKDQQRRYNAATKGRRTDGWNSSGSSANTEIAASLTELRNKSRDMERNNPYAKRAIDAIETNTIGGGIIPAFQSASQPERDRINDLWQDWAGTTECDFDGQADFYGLQGLVMRTVALSGEALVLRRKNARAKIVPFQLQVLEGDYLDHSRNDLRISGNKGYIMQGIQFDAEGVKTGYWLFKEHPAEGMSIESHFVKAEDVLHIYLKERPGQLRGVPMGAASMMRLQDFDDYEDAQLIKQKISACFSAFVIDMNKDTVNSTKKSDLEDRLEPGMVYHTGANEDVRFATPPTTEGYAEYSRSVLRGISSGYGTTYESMSGDLSNVNFSSGRMGWIEFRLLVEKWQNKMFVPMCCGPVFKWFKDGLIMKGNLNSASKIKVQWTPPRREMIQPSEEIKAMVDQVRAGLMSWQDAVRKLGENPDTVFDELKADKTKFDTAGLILTVDASHNLVKKVTEGEPVKKPPIKKVSK